MKLNEMTYDILSAIRELTDNSDITELYVEELINQYRARYVRREYAKRPYITIDTRQSIVVPMELVNSSVIGLEYPTNTLIMRTEVELPSFLTLGKHPGIFTLSTIDRNIGEFELMEKRRARYALDSPTCSTTMFLDTDNRLYLVSKKDSYKNLKYIVIDAVLEDPREAVNFRYIDEDGSTVNINGSYELGKYPVGKSMWTYIKADIINELLRMKSTAPDLESKTADSNQGPQSNDGTASYMTETRSGI